jgi:hypothetical protein
MRKIALLIVALLGLGQIAISARAQQDPKKPKNEVTKVVKARHTDRTTRQVTPDPKKSPDKHAKNLSKNVNHETNRTSKKINHLFQGKKKHKDKDKD